MKPVLTVSGVEKRFGETRALDGAAFELKRGVPGEQPLQHLDVPLHVERHRVKYALIVERTVRGQGMQVKVAG